jgi:hypothetical protein
MPALPRVLFVGGVHQDVLGNRGDVVGGHGFFPGLEFAKRRMPARVAAQVWPVCGRARPVGEECVTNAKTPTRPNLGR